MSVIICNRIR